MESAQPAPALDTNPPGAEHWWLRGRWPWIWVVALGCLLYLPFLGSSGLWDPWEPHYAEVAREMVESGNWLEPTWEHSPDQPLARRYFFSKPALILWLLAVPMRLFGIHDPNGGIVPWAEWALRVPFALLAIGALLLVFALGRRFFGTPTGLLAAFILATCPQFFFIARQTMTDMPFLALMGGGLCLLLLGGFDDGPERTGLLYAGYAALGLSVLAKGLTGVLLPGLLFLLYFLFSGDWRRLGRMRLFTGGALAAALAMPWFVYLSIASALRGLVDDEGKTFFQRFFLHDHLYRLASGVHGDRGTFAYFVEQLGLGTHPWFPFMVWGSARAALDLDRRAEPGLDRTARVELFLFLWVFAGFAFYSLSVTKFHHYALPLLPAMALLAARWLVRWARGEATERGPLVALLLVVGVVLIGRDIGLMPKGMVDLFVYNYTRAFPKDEALVGQIGFGVIHGATALALAALFFAGLRRLARWAAPVLIVGACLGAIWGGWAFFPTMGAHWSQRHLFDTYFALRQDDEPIGAYLMNWRGETFYSRNKVVQIKSNASLKSWLAQHAGKRRFLLVEQHRLDKVKEQLDPSQLRSLRILDRSCNKFFLLSVEDGPPPS